MKHNKIIIFSLIIVMFLINLISAEQVIWDDDSNIIIYDNWKDIDGLPLTNSSCNWYLYNDDGSLNSTGNHTEISPGNFKIQINKKSIGTYPFRFNCSKSGYYGVSSKDSLRIVDELTEDFKDQIDEINLTSKEINQTTHEIQDFLVSDLNNTLNDVLNIVNLNNENLTEIRNNLSLAIENIDEIYEYLEEKWGDETADDLKDSIKNKIEDLETSIQSIEYRLGFSTNIDLETSLNTIKQNSKQLLSILNNGVSSADENLLWVFPSLLIFLFLLIVSIIIFRRKK